MKLQIEVQGGAPVLSIISEGATIDVSIDGTLKDGVTPYLQRIGEKLQKAAAEAAAGKDYRYALVIR